MTARPLGWRLLLAVIAAVVGTIGGTNASATNPTQSARGVECALAALQGGAPPDICREYDTVGLVDPATGRWHLYDSTGEETTSFYFGDPGDVPFVGDWDCDGVDTPGLYRQSDGYVYLRNANSHGIADISFFFGNPGDIPLAGDFNGDGCDTVSLYRRSLGEVYVINRLGSEDTGLGRADYSFFFGDPGDKPFTGDFNRDGVDNVGLHRESTGLVYYRNANTTGVAENEFYFGDPGDRFVVGEWHGSPGLWWYKDTPAVYRPSDRTFYIKFANSQGKADIQLRDIGDSSWLPVAGHFGIEDAPGEPAPGLVTFQRGAFVSDEVPAGRYRSENDHWCIISMLGCSDGQLVSVAEGETAFQGSAIIDLTLGVTTIGGDCGTWSNDLSPRTQSPTADHTDGDFLVGTEVAPGLWRNNNPVGQCYWARLRGFSRESFDIIDDAWTGEPATVRIEEGDIGFTSWNCGSWTYLGP